MTHTICMSDKKLHVIGGELPSIEVIAYQLAHINRYNGAVGTYSVAQHCVLASVFIDDTSHALAALLHDAPEAVYGDISSPLKRALDCPNFKALEAHYHTAVDNKYHVNTLHPKVTECDMRMLVTEAKSFGLPLEFFPDFEPYDCHIQRWSPSLAEREFLRTFRSLTEGAT
jgi:uncharacterized protein